MDGRGVGRHQRVQLAEAVGGGTALEAGGDLAHLGVHVLDAADVAVVDLPVVVVLDLHHLVAGGEGPAEALHLALAGRVQGRLELDVEGARADPAPVHGAEHLDVVHRMKAETPRDAGADEFQDQGYGGLRIVRRHEVEVALALGPAKVRDRALVDAVGVDDDPAHRRLAEHLGQAHHRDRPRGDDVGQHLARSHRGKLVDVADDQQGGVVGDRLQERVHQQHVHHRRFVDHEQIAVDGTVRIPPEAAGGGIDFEQPVDGARLESRRLGHAPRRPAGGRAEDQAGALGGQDAQDGVDDGGLADAGAAGDDQHLGGQGEAHRGALARGEGESGSLLDPGKGLVRVDPRPGQGAGGDAVQAAGDAALRPEQPGEKDAGRVADPIRDHVALGQLLIDGRADEILGRLQQRCGQRQ